MKVGFTLCRYIILVTAAGLVGCSTVVTSERFTGTQEGIRYALPIPILEVLPQPDGSITVNVKYLPDPNNEYVLRTKSFVSAYTLDVKAGEDRLLQTVTLDQDSTAVADAAIKALSEVAKTKIETAKGERDKEIAASKGTVDKVATAQASLDKAEAKLAALKELAKKFPSDVSSRDIITAEIAVAEYRADLKSAQAAANRLGLSSFDAPAAEVAGFPQAWGPVYYRLEQKRDPKTNKIESVKLISFAFPNKSGQQLFDTSTIGRATSEPASRMASRITPTLKIKGNNVVSIDKAGNVTFEVEVTAPIAEVVDKDTKVFSQTDLINPLPQKPIIKVQQDKKTLLVNLKLPPGHYVLLVGVRDTVGEIHASSVSFEVVK
jgi:hypothetical protein